MKTLTEERNTLTDSLFNLSIDRQIYLSTKDKDLIFENYILEFMFKRTNNISNPIGLSLTAKRNIIFKNCIFKGEVEVGYTPLYGFIVFDNCIFDADVQINSNNIKFRGENNFLFNLTLNLATEEFHFKSLEFEKELRLLGKCNSLFIENINQKRNVEKQTILVEALFFKLVLSNVKANKVTLLENTNMVNILFQETQINEFKLEKYHQAIDFHIRKCIIENIPLFDLRGENNKVTISHNSTVSYIGVDFQRFEKIGLIDSNITTVLFLGTLNVGSIATIENLQFGNICFTEVNILGKLIFRQLKSKEDSKLVFYSSTLNNADFIHCDFRSGFFEFDNSKVTSCFFSVTDFPKVVLSHGKINYDQAQLAFGQLATAFQKQGDTVRYLEYQSREIESHYHTINFFSKDFFKKLNLGLNRVSNNFGRYWALSIVFTFASGLLLFICLLVSTKEYHWGWPMIDWNLLPAYLKFMNPLRFIDTEALFTQIPNISLHPASYFWDFLGRIFVAYGYYQTIQAFRRFGRK